MQCDPNMQASASTVRSENDTRVGALCWLAGTVAFVLAMIIVELAYGCSNFGGCYNPLTNPISDLGSGGFLGNPAYPYSGSQIPWPTSPLWPLFNYAIVALGALLVAGAFRLNGAFPSSNWTRVSLVIFAVAGFGAAGVGIVPEDTILAVHSNFALVAFGGVSIAVLLMGLALLAEDRRWGRGWAIYTIASGVFALAATVVLEFPSMGVLPAWTTYGSGFGFGGMERLVIVAPILWLILSTIHILRWPSSTRAGAHPTNDAASAP
jgi:hypothetical membrane protein